MDFTVYKNKIPANGHEVMQRFGYARIVSHHTGKESFVKRLYREHYPRFHCYLKETTDQLTFSLHLDQKEASYKGNHMHSGEYDGPLVEQEIANLKQFIVDLVKKEQEKTQTSKISETKATTEKPWWKIF